MPQHQKSKPDVGNRLKDFALYVLICVVVLATIAGLASTGMKWEILFKLLQSLMFPVLLFGIAVPKRQPQREKSLFWLTICVALLVHTLLFAILASRIESLKPVVTCAIAVPEFLVWMIVNHWQMNLANRRSKRGLSS